MISIYEKRCLQGSILEFLRYAVYIRTHTRTHNTRAHTHIHIHAYTYIFAILAVYLFLLQIIEFL